MRSVDRVVVFEKIRALEERLDDIVNRLDTLFSSFYCSSESSSSETDSSEESDTDYAPYKAPIDPKKKDKDIVKSGYKKVKPRRNLTRAVRFD